MMISMMLYKMVQSFDHGYYLLVKSIQELREKKEGLVTVGIGGPSGSGKSRYICCVMFFFFFVKFVEGKVFFLVVLLNCSNL